MSRTLSFFILWKQYKTINQIKSHLSTKKHFNKFIKIRHNTTLIKPPLSIEGNPFIKTYEPIKPEKQKRDEQNNLYPCLFKLVQR